MKEQEKYDQMPSSLLDRLQCVFPLADKVADEIVGEETEILDKIMPEMLKVMQKIARSLCDYVKRGRFSRLSIFWISQMLMIVERTGDALIDSRDKEMMEAMDGDLANVIGDFERAVNVRLAKRNGKHSLSQYSVGPFSVVSSRTS